MGITIREVAEHAGVSISTVSRVLNNTCPVDDTKRRRVEAAVKALSYTPNPAARSLHSQKTGGLGIVLPFVGGEFFSQFLSGIDSVAQDEGFFLLISTSHHSRSELKMAWTGMSRRVDGVVMLAPQMRAEDIDFSVSQGIPTVFVNTQTDGVNTDSVMFDNFGGMYAMTTHLLSKGHRRIGFIKGPSGAYDAVERHRGYTQALTDLGVKYDPELVINGDYTQKAGHEAASLIIKQKKRPTALMASNDLAAFGAMSALREHGVSIPGDVAVTGFDDLPSAFYSSPRLTTVHVPVNELGMTAIRLLIDRISVTGSGDREQRTLPIRLMLREST